MSAPAGEFRVILTSVHFTSLGSDDLISSALYTAFGSVTGLSMTIPPLVVHIVKSKLNKHNYEWEWKLE